MVIVLLITMTLLAYKLGAFDEYIEHRQMLLMDHDVMIEIDEATWEDRQIRFRATHPGLGQSSYISLGRRR